MSCVVFAYSQLGYECLKFLIAAGHDVLALFTHEDSPKEFLWFDSCCDLAHRKHIPVYTPSVLDEDVAANIKALNPQIIFSFYYRSIIPEFILDLAPLGAFNMHGSLLPKYRGRAPLNWAIIHGEQETGVTLHHMVKEADAGDVVDQESIPISKNACAGDVMSEMTKRAVRILYRQLPLLMQGNAPRYAQDHTQATYFGARKLQDGQVDWTQKATQIHNLIRALLPFPQYPAAFGFIDGKKFMFMNSNPCDGHFPPVAPGTITHGSSPLIQVSCGPDGTERIDLTVHMIG
jgi:methionyl-tRNA formyltransferase